MLYQKLWQVNISEPLKALATTQFTDTGGTNGWIARPDWLDGFVASLGLGGNILYSICRKLPAQQGIPPHIDGGNHPINRGRRFHLPLITHPNIIMRWPDAGVDLHLEEGYLYEVRFDQLHEIVHKVDQDRVHIQISIKDPAVPPLL